MRILQPRPRWHPSCRKTIGRHLSGYAPAQERTRDTMTEIIPRWEWRTFGRDFGETEPPIRTLAVKMEEAAKVIATVRPGGG